MWANAATRKGLSDVAAMPDDEKLEWWKRIAEHYGLEGEDVGFFMVVCAMLNSSGPLPPKTEKGAE